ncbi:MAG TPA: toast rack family protein [Bryobacteraceae bacterium]|nr:toast rack family protein [Bryobacteraceae bacterium]
MRPVVPAALAAGLILATAGCTINDTPDRWTRHWHQTVELGRAESVRASIEMGAGALQIHSGTAKLLDADFTYNHEDWKPRIDYDGGSFRGILTVRQPNNTHSMGHVNYSWDLRFNEGVPLDLRINCGAGEGKLELGRLNLRSLEVNMGVGRIEADLRGRPKRDYDVKIDGGIGEAVVYLPNTAGVVADAQGGIGGIDVQGLHKSGDRWVNDIYERSRSDAPTIHVAVHGGIGSIKLRAD